MQDNSVIVIGAGIGGLTAGLYLANRGFAVTVVERAGQPGGKLRQIEIGGRPVDGGPTVFTMRWIFDRLFDSIGRSLDDHLGLNRASLLARHAWLDGERLDLFADQRRSEDAIATFAGAREARGYRSFCAESAAVFNLLKEPYICRPSVEFGSLVREFGFSSLTAMRRMQPFNTMWRGISRHFQDPRLRQLFGRYATYCGSSPYEAPATLMLVAHVEQDGVWYLDGGMGSLAKAFASLIEDEGGTLRYSSEATRITVSNGRVDGVLLADGTHLRSNTVVMNGDNAALAAGLLGDNVITAVPPVPLKNRSLSALTWMINGHSDGFPLVRHSVFFSSDYRREFNELFLEKRLPGEPTVYVCAQDRRDVSLEESTDKERFLLIVNAPAIGDRNTLSKEEIDQCETATFDMLMRCGLKLERPSGAMLRTGPEEWNQLFPGTGGAIYGRVSHGWRASLSRPGCRTKVPGLYLAGGSVHPGPGVPMAALSGLMAAESLVKDQPSTSPSCPGVTVGGTLTR